jgi:SAM-dependent methyltransferase
MLATAEERLRETIDAYERSPELYAHRYLDVDFRALRSEFLGALTTSTGAVLDAGAGPGRDSAVFAQTSHPTVALDLSWEFVKRVSRTTAAHAVRGDLRALPFTSETFEGIWMCASLVHMPDEEILTAMREARRVLRPDGVLFCSIPSGSGDEWRADQSGHRRWFHYLSPSDATRLAADAGFLSVRSSLDEGVVAGQWINLWARNDGRK